MKTFSWQGKLAEGRVGERQVIAWLRSRGHHVQDVSADPRYQAQDIDLLVDGQAVEIKSEKVARTNLFLEFQALQKSRAAIWVYVVPDQRLLFAFPRRRLERYAQAMRASYQVHTIWTRDGERAWSVEGIAVPMVLLLADLGGKVWRMP